MAPAFADESHEYPLDFSVFEKENSGKARQAGQPRASQSERGLMLTIYGSPSRFCDGISRRNFLKIGALGLGGLSLPQLLHAEAASGIRHSHKAVIMIFLPGGPSHQDIFDLKMDAPAEVRGEFKPIKTNVSGIEICE